MGSWKIEQELAAAGLPQFLRDLATALESGAAGDISGGVLSGLPLDDLRKLVLVAERRSGAITLKLKAKRSGEVRVPTKAKAAHKPAHMSAHMSASKATPPHKVPDKDKDKAQAAREKYRQLKKTLQTDFKAMQAAAGEGRLPGGETLESFLCLAELMAQGEQPVSGAALAEMAPANTAFLDDCQALRRAHSARDAAALGAALERLARRKSACHAQFR
ncbi:MAG: GAK system XXXCH domain-containing protein [Proteobacteria bacterium]|nr:GAK system XXXCH domain-containing protein [Pseudomonadota bacterium]